MKKHDVVKTIKLLVFGIFVLILVVMVYQTSYSLLTNSIIDWIGIDEKSSENISFNYSMNDKQIIEISNPKVLSDFRGKHLLKNNYFDFEIEVPSHFDLDKKMYYEIVLSVLNENIDSRYIKVYLTDQDNKAIDGFSEAVPLLSVFPESDNGKIIYTGSFGNDDMNDKYRLRIWISDNYNKKIDSNLSYQLLVKVK